jgi:starvation-inducible DNA-binding protein
MDELSSALKVALGNTFVMYFQAHSYHWNVEGVHFSQYHDFFGDIYEEVYSSVDSIAEKIRALDVYAPISLKQIYKYSTIEEDVVMPTDVRSRVQLLLSSNQIVLQSLNSAFKIASDQNKQGIADILAGRIDAHDKHQWMLTSSLKGM